MLLELNCEDPRWDEAHLRTLAIRASTATLAELGHADDGAEISVLACDDARIRGLNAQFRGKDSATNVLSWPSWDLSAQTPGDQPDEPVLGTPDAPELLGDMALSYDTCQREAEAQGKTLDEHTTHLIVHSVLHLLGFDHETDEDAVLMEKTETSVLAKLGIADPYAESSDTAPTGVTSLD